MSLHHSSSHHSHHHSQRYSQQGPARQISQSTSYPDRGTGYSSRYGAPQSPPPGADPQLWQWFGAVDTDRSGEISVTELQAALVNGNWTRFDLDTVKMLMNMFDVDRSGAIGFSEFSGLWKYIAEWQNVFRHFDRDNSGSIEGPELAEALRSFGYGLSPSILSLIEQKYGPGPTAGNGPRPGITFDRFVRACVVVKSLTEAFQRVDTDRDGWIQISYEQFMQIFLGVP